MNPTRNSAITPFEIESQHKGPGLDHVKKYTGFTGKLMGIFGLAVQVKNEKTGEAYYVKIQDIADELFKSNPIIHPKEKKLLNERIIEITGPDSRKPVSQAKLERLFSRYFEDKTNNPDLFKSEADVIKEVEKLKIEMSDIPLLRYKDSIEEVAGKLKPGDIIFRKYHEDNPNTICDAQKFFQLPGYREAFKFSHMAIYLGEINGAHWVAEASMPHGKEAQVRRVRLDDPRFALKEKNQYLVVRKKNTAEAEEAARLAKRYTIKLLPEAEKQPTDADLDTIGYTYFEAIRSMYHSPSLGYFGRQRLLKYYADYKNAIPFEYLGQERKFFCSNFGVVMESISEMNKSPKFQEFLRKHPIPAKFDETKKGPH